MNFRDSRGAFEYTALPMRVPFGFGAIVKVSGEPASYLP